MGNVHVLIAMGLPGSGKSSWADEAKRSCFGNDIHVIHLDDIKEKYFWGNRYAARDYIRKGMEGWRGQGQILLDGLFLTNDDLFNAITCMHNYAGNEMNVIIHRWNENRDICLKNDGGRREKKSTGTILNAKYEDVDTDALNDRLHKYGATNVEVTKVIRHSVVLKPDWLRYFKSHVDVDQDGKLRSGRWSVGGCCGNCYDNDISYFDGEEPLEFTILDDFLDEKCPNLRYQHYRQIRKECVSTEKSSESEYYGGCTNYMNWVCDLQKMYDMLEEFGYDVTPE